MASFGREGERETGRERETKRRRERERQRQTQRERERQRQRQIGWKIGCPKPAKEDIEGQAEGWVFRISKRNSKQWRFIEI